MKISKDNSPHYKWGHSCDGWVLSSHQFLLIQERMPPGTFERRHIHSKARQFFYVLSGQLTMELDGNLHVIPSMCGIEIAPGAKHQARNDDEEDVHFLVFSSPTTRGDRTDL